MGLFVLICGLRIRLLNGLGARPNGKGIVFLQKNKTLVVYYAFFSLYVPLLCYDESIIVAGQLQQSIPPARSIKAK